MRIIPGEVIRLLVRSIAFCVLFAVVEVWPQSPAIVSVVLPDPMSFGDQTFIKIDTQIGVPEGSIDQVQFFLGPNLIGTRSNPPFAMIWQLNCDTNVTTYTPVRAVLFTKSGQRAESVPVAVGCSPTRRVFPVLRILTPSDGDLIPLGKPFAFAVDLLAGSGDTGPLQFFAGTNLLATLPSSGTLTADLPPASIAVSNLAKGDYTMSVAYVGRNGGVTASNLVVRVVDLGIGTPQKRPDGRVAFEVVTSFLGKSIVIQRSSDLTNWIAISTNIPSSNYYNFVEQGPADETRRWYRAAAPEIGALAERQRTRD